MRTYDSVKVGGDPVRTIRARNLDEAARIAASRARPGETVEIDTGRRVHKWTVGALGIRRIEEESGECE